MMKALMIQELQEMEALEIELAMERKALQEEEALRALTEGLLLKEQEEIRALTEKEKARLDKEAALKSLDDLRERHIAEEKRLNSEIAETK